jgi:hypothetical protein
VAVDVARISIVKKGVPAVAGGSVVFISTQPARSRSMIRTRKRRYQVFI